MTRNDLALATTFALDCKNLAGWCDDLDSEIRYQLDFMRLRDLYHAMLVEPLTLAERCEARLLVAKYR